MLFVLFLFFSLVFCFEEVNVRSKFKRGGAVFVRMFVKILLYESPPAETRLTVYCRLQVGPYAREEQSRGVVFVATSGLTQMTRRASSKLVE